MVCVAQVPQRLVLVVKRMQDVAEWCQLAAITITQ